MVNEYADNDIHVFNESDVTDSEDKFNYDYIFSDNESLDEGLE